ncbi:glycosyltransferase family 4 protein [Patescibacteria group bacterium]|nr:glycosyltransferase family 4 protein [Patescibacteria group bacterium]MBU1028681.1 glycosyltransferase family 4 protein [Patescibacteria group bacterium]MBU1915881.1 glycosyltransferase family 4 protein [Patescibacteria group bacterium]
MKNDQHKFFRIAMIGARSIPITVGSGGVERHVEELSARLVTAGHQVTAYVQRKNRVPENQRGIKLVPVISVSIKGLGTLLRVFISTCRVLFSRFDIVHFHGVGPATFAWLPRLLRPRMKVLVTFHSIDRLHAKWGRLACWYLRYGEWAALRFPHSTISVSRAIQKYCDLTYQIDTIYVPNGATISEYPGSDQLAHWGLKPDGYILAVGRLVGQKGFHYLIDAYQHLETDKKLVIVGGDAGGGDYADYLRQTAAGNSNIIFTDFQSGRMLAQLYANAYLYIHPSEAEGLSVAILEAMAAGRCVLVSDILENREPLDHSGLTFISGDTEDLTKQLQSLLNHPEIVTERGARAAKWISAEYSWERVTAMTEQVYRELF